ncbi:hypothetical protein JNJ66_02030 [Candidatus Saccharibacteria bacterium]|nr:hypothetical protein [Candidatus Saccharibacteria bacterium]
MDATTVLVIILSVALAVFLVLGIILVVLLIRVTKQIQSVTTVAKTAADNVQNITANFSKVAAPAAMVNAVLGLLKKRR